MNKYSVGFNDDGILVVEQVEALDEDNAKLLAQDLHKDLQIIFVRKAKVK